MPVEMRGRHMQGAPVAPPIAGEVGSHVGVPPPARPTEFGPVQTVAEGPSTLDLAFAHWRKANDTDALRLVHTDVLYAAFSAGYQMALITVVQVPPLPGTAESRTIIAALRSFMENVLPMASEEIASGEFLSVAEVENLIAKMERNF